MGRRKKRSVRKTHWRDRKPPKVFQCPLCGAVSVVVRIEDENGNRIGYISCSNPRCRMRSRISGIPPLYTPIDVYSRFMDLYTEGKAEIWFEEAGRDVERESGGVSEEEES
ncbi:MAG: hypothetical protein QXX47_02945 [Sulfolobales archaeon]